MRILFVCQGNTCRSPMAVGLASNLLPENFSFDSAGIDADFGKPANPNAIKVMQHEYGIDISDHATKDIETINLDEFDKIIALDEYVYNELISRYDLNHIIMYKWNIDDPYGPDYERYKRCAIFIKKMITSKLK